MKKYNDINSCSFKRRYIAFYIDAFICINIILFAIIPALTLADLFSIEVTDTFVNVFTIFMVILFILLMTIKDFPFKNGSIGKKIMKMKIIDINTKQKPSSLKLMLSNFCFLNFGVIDYFVAKDSLDNRTLAEIVTSTAIVEKDWKPVEEKEEWE